MSNLSRRTGNGLDLVGDHTAGSRRQRPPAHIGRAVREGVAMEHGRAIVQAARVRSLEYVAHEAMQAVAGLTELEGMYIQRSPMSEHRYRTIADTAACAMANIVADASRG